LQQANSNKGKKKSMPPATPKNNLVSAMKRKGETTKVASFTNSKAKVETIKPRLGRRKFISQASDNEDTVTELAAERFQFGGSPNLPVEKESPVSYSKAPIKVIDGVAVANTRPYTLVA
jgi:hypothetical protein